MASRFSEENASFKEENRFIRLIETNIGKWKPTGIIIVDDDFRIWGRKGAISDEVLTFFRKFPLIEMHIGDTIQNENIFMIKITGRMAALVEMEDENSARLSGTNLKGRTNAFSIFDLLVKHIEEAEPKLRVPERIAPSKNAESAEPHYEVLLDYGEISKREKDAFILDKIILKEISNAGSISLSRLRQRLVRFEEMLGERIDLAQIKAICDRYVREGLIKEN